MTTTEATEQTTTEAPKVSQKRQLTATGAAIAVTVVLGIAANYGIGWVAGKVHNQIVPPQTETTTDN